MGGYIADYQQVTRIVKIFNLNRLVIFYISTTYIGRC